jgi:hypothetical protein
VIAKNSIPKNHLLPSLPRPAALSWHLLTVEMTEKWAAS